jgi:hypothetical protein
LPTCGPPDLAGRPPGINASVPITSWRHRRRSCRRLPASW